MPIKLNPIQPEKEQLLDLNELQIQLIRNIKDNNVKMFRNLIEALTVEQLMKTIIQNNKNLLNEACEFGNLQIIKVLINRLGDKAAQLAAMPDNKGNTALHLAARHQSSSTLLTILELLGNNAPDVISGRNKAGCTPLHLAAQYQTSVGFTAMLKATGAKYSHTCNQINIEGKTPMHIAMRYQDSGTAASMLNKLNEQTIEKCINHADKEGYTLLHHAAFRQPLKLVKWLANKGANVFAKSKKGETAFKIAQENDDKSVATYLEDITKSLPNKIEPRENQYIIVRMWPPKYKKRPTKLIKVLRHIGSKEADIGHISIAIRDGNKETYISHWPGEEPSIVQSVPAGTNNLVEDVDAESLMPTTQIVLYSLDIAKMLQMSKELEKKARWHFTGNLGILKKMGANQSYNCSGYVYEVLKAGGLFEQLLGKQDKLSGILTPTKVSKLAKKAKAVEVKNYPEVNNFFENNFNDFKDKLLAVSKNGLRAVNDFLKENPDLYFLYATNYAKVIESVLKQVNENVKLHASMELLDYMQSISEVGKTSNCIKELILPNLDYIIKKQPDLSLTNEKGYNALHCAIERGNLQCVKRLLEVFPQAIDSTVQIFINNMPSAGRVSLITPLDIAIKTGNKAIIDFLKGKGGRANIEEDVGDELTAAPLQIVNAIA